MGKNLHFRRIPDYVEQGIERIESPYILVATTLVVKEEQIKTGEFEYLGIQFIDNKLNISKVISPENLKGRYAKRNLNGYDIVHRDLPKIHKTYSWEVPNFGDPDKGYHEICVTRLVYQRKHIAPREWCIRVELLKEEHLDDGVRLFTFKITVDTILCKTESLFRDDLFFALNLLQENTFSCNVFDAKTTKEDFLKTRSVGWEIFPAGSLEQAICYATSQIEKTDEVKKRIEHRAEFLQSLKPTEYIVGFGMNRRYFGAKFKDNLVVFENIEYGNAIYILFDNWMEISKMSRIEILQRKEKDFIRLPHRKNWEQVLRHNLDKLR